MRGGMSLPSVRPLLGIKYGGQDAFREGISRTLENAFAMQAPSEENETRRPGNHHFKQKALRQCHCTPPFGPGSRTIRKCFREVPAEYAILQNYFAIIAAPHKQLWLVAAHSAAWQGSPIGNASSRASSFALERRPGSFSKQIHASACLSWSRTMKQAELTSIDQAGGKQRGIVGKSAGFYFPPEPQETQQRFAELAFV